MKPAETSVAATIGPQEAICCSGAFWLAQSTLFSEAWCHTASTAPRRRGFRRCWRATESHYLNCRSACSRQTAGLQHPRTVQHAGSAGRPLSPPHPPPRCQTAANHRAGDPLLAGYFWAQSAKQHIAPVIVPHAPWLEARRGTKPPLGIEGGERRQYGAEQRRPCQWKSPHGCQTGAGGRRWALWQGQRVESGISGPRRSAPRGRRPQAGAPHWLSTSRASGSERRVPQRVGVGGGAAFPLSCLVVRLTGLPEDSGVRNDVATAATTEARPPPASSAIGRVMKGSQRRACYTGEVALCSAADLPALSRLPRLPLPLPRSSNTKKPNTSAAQQKQQHR